VTWAKEDVLAPNQEGVIFSQQISAGTMGLKVISIRGIP
jgi:hypothetical protein